MHSHRLSSSSLSVSPPPSPQPSSTTINKSSRSDQIVQSFYGKVAQIVLQSRINSSLTSKDKAYSQGTQRAVRKQNRWFNIETEEVDEYRNETRYWRNASISEDPAPSLIIEIYLDTSDLTPNQIIVLIDEERNKHKIDINNGDRALYFKGLSPSNSKKSILIESWKVELDKTVKDCKLELPTIYKYGITFFRSLYLYARLLPCFELFQRLRRNKGSGIKLGYRFTVSSTSSSHEIGFNPEHYFKGSILKIGTHKFEPLSTPLGNLSLSVTSRLNCNFYLEDGDKLLSSKFQDIDAKIYLQNIIERPISSQKNFSHRRFSSHGDVLDKRISGYNPDPSFQTAIVKSPDNLGDSPSSSSTSMDSNSINRPIKYESRPKSPMSKHGYLFNNDSSTRLDQTKLYDSRSLPRGSSSKNIPSFTSMRSSPPSHVSLSVRRPQSITNFSPFKSPSLSSSPSIHNASPPSRTSSFGKGSTLSLERGIHMNQAKPIPSNMIRPSSPAPSKLSSSFGHRFGSISESPLNQDYGTSPRRAPSIKNSGILDKSTSGLAISTTSTSYDSNKYMNDLSDFIKAVSERPSLKGNDENPNNIQKNIKEYLIGYEEIAKKLEELKVEMEGFLSSTPTDNAVIEGCRNSSPLLQTGFIAEYQEENPTKPLDIPSSNKSSGHKDISASHNSHSIPVNLHPDHFSSDPTSFSLPNEKSQRTSLLSQKLNLEKPNLVEEASMTLDSDNIKK